MMKTATNIIKGVFRHRKKPRSFAKISWLKKKWIKHQEDQKIKQARLSGFTIFYKRPYELLHSFKDIFENEIYAFQTKKSSPLIIDCGSNIGLSVLYFKQQFPSSTVVSFEPDRNNFDLLTQNVKINDLKDVELNKAAVWIKDGEISFEAKESEASHISETTSANNVKCVSLKNILEKVSEVDFLKIDIEGAESYVIRDIGQSLKKVQNLFLEYHGKANETFKLNELFNILQGNGFKVYIRNAADNLSKPFVEKSTDAIYDVQLNLFCYR